MNGRGAGQARGACAVAAPCACHAGVSNHVRRSSRYAQGARCRPAGRGRTLDVHDVGQADFAMLVLPGGVANPDMLRLSAHSMDFIREFSIETASG
jgi:putative intracellular protease/amidase